MNLRLRIRVVVVGLSALIVAPALADGSLSPERRRELLRDGLVAFDQALELSRQDAEQARKMYRRAAVAFETLTESGACNASLEYNLGNAYFRLGDLGRAVLHYRRGLRLDPANALLNENLAYVRNRVEPYIAPSGTRQLIERLFFWTNRTSINTRYRLTLIASVAGWLGLAVWLRYRSRALLVLSIIAVAFTVANAGSIAWELREEAQHPPAVIVDGRHVPRLGRGEGYDPALSQTLGPGVEVRIIAERADWAEIQLPDGKTGWLPLSALERI